MNLNPFSCFLISEEAFIELNSNILETNLINILILIALLLYANKISFSVSLQDRQKEIVQSIENAQKDVVNASNYYDLTEKAFTQTLFWLNSWKNLYEKDKLDLVNTKYTLVKNGLLDSFSTAENIITNSEKKAFLSLQEYVLFITVSKIFEKFLFLSEEEQAKILKQSIKNLGGVSR